MVEAAVTYLPPLNWKLMVSSFHVLGLPPKTTLIGESCDEIRLPLSVTGTDPKSDDENGGAMAVLCCARPAGSEDSRCWCWIELDCSYCMESVC
jgi:hypothetical protein